MSHTETTSENSIETIYRLRDQLDDLEKFVATDKIAQAALKAVSAHERRHWRRT